MAITPIKPSGFPYGYNVSSTELTLLDQNVAASLDKRAGQTDTLASTIGVNGTLNFNSGSYLNLLSGSTFSASSGANINITNNANLSIGTNGSLILGNGSNFSSTSGSNINLNVATGSSINIGSTGLLNVNTGGYFYLNSGSNAYMRSSALSIDNGSVVNNNGSIFLVGGGKLSVLNTGTLELQNAAYLTVKGNDSTSYNGFGMNSSNVLEIGNTAYSTTLKANNLAIQPTSLNITAASGSMSIGSSFTFPYSPNRTQTIARTSFNCFRGSNDGNWSVAYDGAPDAPYIRSQTSGSTCYLEIPKLNNAILNSIVIYYTPANTGISATAGVYYEIATGNSAFLVSSTTLPTTSAVYQSLTLNNINATQDASQREYWLQVSMGSSGAYMKIYLINFNFTLTGAPAY